MEDCQVLVQRPREVGGKVMSTRDFSAYVPKPIALYVGVMYALASITVCLYAIFTMQCNYRCTYMHIIPSCSRF